MTENTNQPFTISVDNSLGYSSGKITYSQIIENASNVITRTVQITYQYNSENYPISSTGVITNYTINSQTGVSTPQAPISQSGTITYY